MRHSGTKNTYEVGVYERVAGSLKAGLLTRRHRLLDCCFRWGDTHICTQLRETCHRLLVHQPVSTTLQVLALS